MADHAHLLMLLAAWQHGGGELDGWIRHEYSFQFIGWKNWVPAGGDLKDQVLMGGAQKSEPERVEHGTRSDFRQ